MRIFLILISLSVSISSYAGTDSHGGGTICVQNHCMTLAEAGFRIVTPSNTPVEISQDVINELKKIDSELPTFKYQRDYSQEYKLIDISNIIGKPGDVQFVTSVNDRLISKFFKEYTGILKDNNAQQLVKDFSIAGFTVDRYHPTTYIILDRYNNLSTVRSKALLLIHEYSLRVNRKSLEETLKFDGALVDYLHAKETNSFDNFNTLNFLKVTVPKELYSLLAWGDILHRTGPQPVDEVFTSYRENYRGSDAPAILSLDYMKILEDRKYDPQISSYIEPGEYSFTQISREDILNTYINEIVNFEKNQVAVFTNKSFSNFLSGYIIDNPVAKDMIRELNNCKKSEDTSVKVMSFPFTESIFNGPLLLECRNSYIKQDENPILSSLIPYLNGMTLNIPGKLICTEKNYETTCHLEK